MDDFLSGLILGAILGFTACVGLACVIVGRIQADLFEILSKSPGR